MILCEYPHKLQVSIGKKMDFMEMEINEIKIEKELTLDVQ